MKTSLLRSMERAGILTGKERWAAVLKCVIFDMDGTLLDTERLAVQFWVDMAKEYGVDLPMEFIVSNCGRPGGTL